MIVETGAARAIAEDGRDITLAVTGENLWLWTKYNGFDPDVSSEGTSSTLRRVDMGAYPRSRMFVFSIQLRY